MRLLLALLAATGLTACGGNTVKLFLTDAPLDGATEVNVKVEAVELLTSAGAKEEYLLTFDPPREFNLLELRDGKRAELGELQVEGEITQIRLHIDGTAQVVYEGGESATATVPSGAQTGIKIITRALDPAKIGEITLDFDAAESIVQAGEQLLLKPTIKVLVGDEVVGDSTGEEQ